MDRLTTGTVLLATALLLPTTGKAAPQPGTPEEPTVLEQAQTLIDAGRFRDAENLLRPLLRNPEEPVVDDIAVALEVLRRIRLDYALAPEALLERIRRSVPDATAADIERWRASGALQHREIDGQVRYFGREPGNLFRFTPEAAARRTPVPPPASAKFDLPAHLARLLVAARDERGLSDRPNRQAGLTYPVHHRVTYEVRVPEDHPRVKPGARVRAWLPFPQEYGAQTAVRLIRSEPPGATVTPNGVPHRAVYFEHTLAAGAPARFLVEFEYTMHAQVTDLDPARATAPDERSALYREYTVARPPHILFTPEVRALAAEFSRAEPNPLLRARAIFRWVAQNIPWCAEMEYSTIPSLSAKGLTARRGDCGVQALVFITLCRAAGIPARWQSGWQTLPDDWNMHDWAEFYIEPWGWLPADPSYGLQTHPDPEVQEFYCGRLDPYRLIVNLDYACPLTPEKTSFRSEPNDFQRGEIEIDGHNLYFNEWRWSFAVETEPLLGGFGTLEELLAARVPAALRAGGISGAVVAVGQSTPTGFRTWQRAYGHLAREPELETMPEDAVFDLASLTKPIASGTSLLRLVEQGLVDLDAPVSRYLPDFAGEYKDTVTVRQLMSHTSGLVPYLDADTRKRLQEEAGFPCPDATRVAIRQYPAGRRPGEVVVYSCLNAILCAEIVAAVSGRPLDLYFEQEIAQPLGLSSTRFCPPPEWGPRLVPTTRAAYGRGPGGFLRGQVHDPVAALQGGVSGNAGLFGSAADLARFAQMLLSGGELDGVRILRRETLAEATRVQTTGLPSVKGTPDRRGLLWDLYLPLPESPGPHAPSAFGHTGYTGTALRIYPEHGTYVIVLANRAHPDDKATVEALRQAVWSTAIRTLMDAPR
ncbi:MAG: serine hydrolase [Phycisphaerales bacterium]|nr:serine hydrolase [Phycisphaerales bacterium]